MNRENYLKEGLDKFKIEYDEDKVKKLIEFMDIVLEENKKFNLTAITEETEFIEKHLIDSSLVIPFLPKEGNVALLDVGSGAGFPGIVIKILREDISITLMDSLNKRVNYLNETINKLKLNDITAFHLRAEEAGKEEKYREKFDIVTARAVANLNTLSEFCLPFVKKGGYFIPLKGGDIKEELSESYNIIGMLGGKVENNSYFQLPFSLAGRSIPKIKKINYTPGKFPRSMKKIKNNKIL